LRAGTGNAIGHHSSCLIGKIAARIIHADRRRPSGFSDFAHASDIAAATSSHYFAEYLPRPACGVFRSATSMLLLRPRLAQPANKSAPEKTPDGFPRSGGRETETPIRPEKILLPKPIS